MLCVRCDRSSKIGNAFGDSHPVRLLSKEAQMCIENIFSVKS